jgi:anhydro-N-acetylmuramic acid kinase
MVYKVIGLMSGSSLDGLDIAYVHLQERLATRQAPKGWDFELVKADCYPYSDDWRSRLGAAHGLSALDYQLLHVEYGRYLGEQVLRFVRENGLEYQVQLVVSHGHTVFHEVARHMTAQLGDGAALAATARVNVVSDLRAMDVSLGGQGAPIVPIGEMLLLEEYAWFLNLGGIANVSRAARDRSRKRTREGAADTGSGSLETGLEESRSILEAGAQSEGWGGSTGGFVAFDVCPANRVLNELAADEGLPYDAGGALAAGGSVDAELLGRLNALPYYQKEYPKSLANEFGTETVLPLIRHAMKGGAGRLTTADALRTYTRHIAEQVGRAVRLLMAGTEGLAGGSAATTDGSAGLAGTGGRMLVTGGGAHNTFLIGQLREVLGDMGVEVVVPDSGLVDYKEALIMALIGVLRWREENNVLASVTGASRDSIGGAVWIGQEA